MRTFRSGALLILMLVVACKREKEAPKLPLGHPDISAAGQPAPPVRTAITGEAKIALDSGNVLYKAKGHTSALAQYRRAAALAPEQEAPLIGMLMVANVTSNARLADSVTAKLRTMNSSLFAGTDSLSAEQLKEIHGGAKSPSPHPPKAAKKL